MEELKVINSKVKMLERLLSDLDRLAKKQYEPSCCPLAHDHDSLSQRIFGAGVYEWTCGFCGTLFTE